MSELKAVGYVRVSTDEQAKEGVSLDNQRQRIELFCQAKDWHLQRVYTDEGRSGKDLKRDGIQQLVEDAKAKDFGECSIIDRYEFPLILSEDLGSSQRMP